MKTPALFVAAVAAAGLGLFASSGFRSDRTEAAQAASVSPAATSRPSAFTLQGEGAEVVASGARAPDAAASAGLVAEATTPEDVRDVLRFTRAATTNDQDALRHAALSSADPLVAGNALKALGRLKLISKDEALLALTSDPRQRVRQDAVTACGLDGGAPALARLEQALATGDASIRPLVLRSLGLIRGDASRRLIEGVASDPQASETDRAFARASLSRLGR